VTVEIYFPSTILMQYIKASTIKELESEVSEGKLNVIGRLLEPDDYEDVHTTVVMPFVLKKYILDLKNRMLNMVLGKDVVLYFRRDNPLEIGAEEEYELLLQLKPSLVNKLKIRKSVVAYRFLFTDMVFRLYYYICNRIKEKIDIVKDLESKICTFSKSAKYESLLSKYIPFNKPVHSSSINVFYPVQLEGVIQSFPLLTKSGVLQLAVMYHVKEEKFKEYGIKVTDEFIEDCESHFDMHISQYINRLDRFINEVKSIVEEEDPLERFLLNILPSTFLDIYERAKAMDLDIDEVMLKLRRLMIRGKIIANGELLIKK